MREIKFRTWDGTKMYYNTDIALIEDENMNTLIPVKLLGISSNSLTCESFKTDTVTLQFTGLYDKNNTPIYEGDIVKQIYTTKVYDIDTDETLIGVVKFIDGSYLVEQKDGYYGRFLFQEIDTNEVIGNIYENPDLI